MSYRALYRLYRPQTFDEVVGQKYIIQTIKNAIRDGRAAHAYLLTGPRGTGKTTIAKLIAKGVNCTGSGEKPCGKCENCQAIANGTHPDVIEIDAASNNSVDEVRDLIEKVKYSPIQGQYKVYIIDEVHMMTPSAFNALLKTLEEPPANVIFILATTEVHKVLPTIVSRCQRFDFGRISTPDIEKRIRTILQEENITYEEGVVSLVASLADGGVRDALGILDQTIAYAGNNLTEKDVRDIYGVVSTEEALEFLDICHQKKIDEALKTVDDFERKGVDLIRLTNVLINILKEIVVFNKTNSSKILRILNQEQVELASQHLSSKNAMEYIDVLLEASVNFRRVNSPKSYFELAVLKLCNVESQEDVVKTVEIIQEVVKEVPVEVVKKEAPAEEFKEEAVEVSKEIEPEPIKEEPKEEVPEEVSVQEEPKEEILETKQPVEEVREEKEEVEIIERGITDEEIFDYLDKATKEDKKNDIDRFNLIQNYLQKPNYRRVAGLLMDCGPIASGPEGLIIGFDLEARAAIINHKDNYFAIKDFLKELLGRDVYFIGIGTEQFKILKARYYANFKNGGRPKNNPLSDRFMRPQKEEVVKQPNEHEDKVAEMKAIFGDLLKIKGE